MRVSEIEATLSFDLAFSSLRNFAFNTLPFAVELYYRPGSDMPRLRCRQTPHKVAKQRKQRAPTRSLEAPDESLRW